MGVSRIAALVVTVGMLSAGLAGRAAADGPTDNAATLERVIPFPAEPLSAGVGLGGLSDLAPAAGGSVMRFWTLTDRGPNGEVEIDGRTRRTLTAPAFVPTVLLCELGGDPTGDGAIVVRRTIPLATRSGQPLSGRPLPGGDDDMILDAAGATSVGHDPDGVDSEAVVEAPDGSLWIAEEYGPSLLHVSAEGRVIARFFPAGAAPAGADTDAIATLPAEYARRRENRGFEALAATADGSRLFVLLQSPLEHPRAKAAEKSGNVRLLVFDPQAGRPVAEHVYRLGDPTDAHYLDRGDPPDDGKLCAIAPLDDATLLVLEQADGGLARLYTADLSAATDTLGWRPGDAGGKAAVEEVRDLAAAGIDPVRKRLVADLGPLVPRIREAVHGPGNRRGKKPPLKLEGLAVLDDRRVAIVNDDDFGVHTAGDGPRPRSCLFVIDLGRPLDRGRSPSPRP